MRLFSLRRAFEIHKKEKSFDAKTLELDVDKVLRRRLQVRLINYQHCLGIFWFHLLLSFQSSNRPRLLAPVSKVDDAKCNQNDSAVAQKSLSAKGVKKLTSKSVQFFAPAPPKTPHARREHADTRHSVDVCFGLTSRRKVLRPITSQSFTSGKEERFFLEMVHKFIHQVSCVHTLLT